MLERFGVDVLDEGLYRTLLMDPESSVESLADVVGAPADGIPAMFERLAADGIVVPRSASPSGFEAVAPQFALEQLIRREEQRLELERARLQQSRDLVPDLVDEYVAARARILGPEIEVLDDATLVRARLFLLNRDAKSTTWSTHVGPALSESIVAQGLLLDRSAADRQVDTRMIVSRESLGTPHWESYLAELTEMGFHLRVMTAVPVKCLIVDGKHAVIPGPSRDGANSGAYLLHGAPLVDPIKALFDALWHQAQPLTFVTDDDGPITDERMRQVAALLSSGLKDEAVGRRLGISVRTVRRIISATMHVLHADSRWQAGALAARLGWDGDETPRV